MSAYISGYSEMLWGYREFKGNLRIMKKILPGEHVFLVGGKYKLYEVRLDTMAAKYFSRAINYVKTKEFRSYLMR